MPRVIVTGGPGVGKTTLLRHLASLGFAVVEESARELIRERRAAGLSPRPGALEFAREILRRDIIKYDRTKENDAWIFFDRSPLEALAMVHEAAPMQAAEVEAMAGAFRFHRTVFVLPPWQEIFTRDDERDHSWPHCKAVHASLVSWYTHRGHVLQEVPRVPVSERAGHVLRVLAQGGA